jgi:hypothetical protein
MRILTFVLMLAGVGALKVPTFCQKLQSATRQLTATVALLSVLGSPLACLAEESTLASQLKDVVAKQVSEQKTRIEAEEQQLMTQELLYPDGKLIGRGIVKLVPNADSPNQLKAFQASFPYGYPDAASLDPAFSEEGTMFVLAVGRDGPPLAAKRIKTKDVAFPIAFELTSSDLVFPYTPEAWVASPNSKDTIALTVILTPGNVLAAPSAAGRVGFGLSEPSQVAGSACSGMVG